MLEDRWGAAPAAIWSPAVVVRPVSAAAAEHLARYFAGWAAADAALIAAAVADGYRFVDPLVGEFDRHGLAAYLALLRQRVGFATVRGQRRKVCFEGQGPPGAPGRPLRFWRALPETGLAGTAEIELCAAGVRRETVCYEANLATEQLRAGAQPALKQRAAR